MSELADCTYKILRNIYPFNSVVKEHYTNYKGSRLFFDFFIKSLQIAVECQGQQHFKFNKFHYNTIKDFYAQKRRDNLKIEYCEENGISLVFINYNDIVTEDLVLERIYEAL